MANPQATVHHFGFGSITGAWCWTDTGIEIDLFSRRMKVIHVGPLSIVWTRPKLPPYANLRTGGNMKPYERGPWWASRDVIAVLAAGVLLLAVAAWRNVGV